MPRVRYKHNPQPTRDEMKIMIKQQLLQVTMLLNQLGEAYRHINDLEELLQKKKKKEEDEAMNGLFEKKKEEEEEKKEKEEEEKEGVLTNGPKEGEKVESKPSNNIAASFAAQVRCHCDCF